MVVRISSISHWRQPSGVININRGTAPEPRRRLATRKAFLNRPSHSIPKIDRQGSEHPCQPPSPAGIVNHKTAALEIHF